MTAKNQVLCNELAHFLVFHMFLFLHDITRSQHDSNTEFKKNYILFVMIVIKGNQYIKYLISPVTLYDSNFCF